MYCCYRYSHVTNILISYRSLTTYQTLHHTHRRQKYDRADLSRRIQSKCKFRLESQRREYTREGRSWRHVADATKR